MRRASIVSVFAVAVAMGAGAAEAEQHGNAERPDHGSAAHAAPSHATLAKAIGAKASQEITIGHLMDILRAGGAAVKAQVGQRLNADGLDSVSIGDMFETQMSMNRLSQISEMSTSTVGASNSALGRSARNNRN